LIRDPSGPDLLFVDRRQEFHGSEAKPRLRLPDQAIHVRGQIIHLEKLFHLINPRCRKVEHRSIVEGDADSRRAFGVLETAKLHSK
jgi:hypothetical protein